MINAIIAITLVVIASFTVLSGLVAGYYLFYALFTTNKDKAEKTIEGVNPVLGTFLRVWIGTRRTIDGILKWDLGPALLTMLVVSIVVVIVLAWESLSKWWTLGLLFLGAAVQVIIGTYVLSKMGIRGAAQIVNVVMGKKYKCQRCGIACDKVSEWEDRSSGGGLLVCPDCMQELDEVASR